MTWPDSPGVLAVLTSHRLSLSNATTPVFYNTAVNSSAKTSQSGDRCSVGTFDYNLFKKHCFCMSVFANLQ